MMIATTDDDDDDMMMDPAVLLPLLLGLSRSSGCSSSSISSIAMDVDHATTKAITSEGGVTNDENKPEEEEEEAVVEGGIVKRADNPFSFLDDSSIATLSFPAKLHHLLSIVPVAAAAAQPTMPPSFSNETTTTTTTTTNAMSSSSLSNNTNNNNSNVQSYYSHILSWTDHGRSFQIHDPLALEQLLLPRYFFVVSKNEESKDDDSTKGATNIGGTRMELFQRELIKWGFRTCHGTTTTQSSSATTTTNTNKMEYYHPDFLRCHFDKAQHIVCCGTPQHDDAELSTSTNPRGGGQSLAAKSCAGSSVDLEETTRNQATRRDENDAVMENPGVEQGVGEGEAESGHDRNLEGDEEVNDEVMEQLTNFMAVTGSDNAIVARQYLEMSGNHLETAISLFLDHGGAGGTVASASGEATAMTGTVQGTFRGGEDNDMQDDEEPNFYALPPMPPLSSSLNQASTTTTKKRRVLPAERIVESALREYSAFRTIRRALLTYWIRPRHSSQDGVKGGRSQQSKQEGRKKELVGVALTGLPQEARAAPKKKFNTLPRGPVSHFLFQSLLHPSLPVRRTAARMILHNFHLILQRDCNNTRKKDAPVITRGDLQEVLITLLHGLMFGEAPYYQQHQRTILEIGAQPHHKQQQQRGSALPMIPCFKNQFDGGDPALQIMGLLVSLICDGGFSNILVCDEVMELFQQQKGVPTCLSGGQGGGKGSSGYLDMGAISTKDDILASSLLRELSSDSIESFVAGGGLRWACGSILRLVQMLVHGSTRPIIAVGGTRQSHVGTNANGGDSSNVSHFDGSVRGHLVDPMDDITSCTLQNRLLILIDLVYRLVLFGSIPAAVDRHSLGLRGEDDSVIAREKACSKPPAKGNNSNRNESISNSSTYSQVLRSRARKFADLSQRFDGSISAVQGVAAGSGTGSVAGADRTARTSYFQRLASRSSGGVPPNMARSSNSRSSGSKRSFINSVDDSAKGGGIGGGYKGRIGQHGPSASVSDETCRRKDSRRSTLERVHKVLWSSDLPAAVCVLPDRTTSIVTPEYGVKSDVSSSTAAVDVSSLAGLEHLSALACLIAAHEILRSRPISHAALSINQRLRALEKGIAILGRIVDPGASTAVVTLDSDLPWELARKLICDDYGKKSLPHGTGAGDLGVDAGYIARRCGAITHPRSSRDHNHFDSTTTGLSPSRIASRGVDNGLVRDTDSSPYAVGHRTKRSRYSSSNVSSILEHLPRVESPTGGAASSNSNSARSGLAAAQVETLLGAASLPIGGVGSGVQSSNSAARYRSATESIRRFSALGAENLNSRASSSVSSRDGTLSRLLALGGGSTRADPFGTSGTQNSSNIRAGSSNSVSTTASPAMSTASRNLMRERALAATELEEWRVLQDLPEGGDLMDIDDDVAYLSNVEDDEDNIDDEEGASEEGGNSDADEDELEDSDAESVFEVNHLEHSNNKEYDEENVVNEGGDDSEGEDEEDAVVRSKTYDEETDDDVSQFDDAVINLEDINHTTSSGTTRCELSQQGHHPIRNPHRQSLRIPASSQLESGASLLNEVRDNSCSSKCISPLSAALMKREREQAYVRAAMSILSVQRPGLLAKTAVGCDALLIESTMLAKPCTTIGPPLLTCDSEQSLLKSLCHVVKPPRKPLNLKIFLRRAPTQEEYFRGSLSRNPISLSSLRAACTPTGTGGGSGGVNTNDRRISNGGVGQSGSNDEPLVSDLRMHIARDLQMEESSELLELLVANKIIDMNLKLRVVQQVLWRRYVEENATSASSLGVAGAGPSHQMISTGNGLSMIFNSSGLVDARNRTISGGRETVVGSDESALLESFPPMVVTYRLAGVDGEATEDKVEFDDLDDPEAPSIANLSPTETERRMEKEFGITRLILARRNGVALLLENIECTISDCLRRIRRDEVARRHSLRSRSFITNEALNFNDHRNGARERFARAPPCPGLVLLRLCANISDNRKLMLANRAPTLLLRILLDILNTMNKSSEVFGSDMSGRVRSSTFDSSAHSMEVEPAAPCASAAKVVDHVDGNPTADALQEIIEMLASDISSEICDGSKQLTSEAKIGSSSSFVSLIQAENCQQTGVVEYQDEDRSLPLVLRSLYSTELSPPLQKVIAKLLPFLTYGQLSQSIELASYFCKYINVDRLGVDGPHCSDEQERHTQGNALMTTFVEAAINLPPVPICDNLRKELLSNGFVDCVQSFLMDSAPTQPPPWSPALYSVSLDKSNKIESLDLIGRWRNFLNRPGLIQAFKILTGLCSRHVATQVHLSGVSCSGGGGEKGSPCEGVSFLMLCHWIEITSDNTAANVQNPCGILAETLLDALKEDNESCSTMIDALRRKTRECKRKLAEERRSKALGGIPAFGAYAEQRTLPAAPRNSSSAEEVSADNRSMFAVMFSSLLAPTSSSTLPCTRASVTKEATVTTQTSQQRKILPSWVAEMEALADEAGVTCAVCQEGRSLQPSELLGLYAYMKKVTIPSSQGGGKGDIDGTVMLLSLPASFPSSLAKTSDMEALFMRSRHAANALEGSSHVVSAMASSTSFCTGAGSGSSRTNYYVTTVSAGNAIHCSCHNNAKAADRNHPKAPKSEWDGANLRNSRVACNVIIPLVSSKTAKVPLMAVETAMAEYNTIVTNTLGARPKSILWSCLHDIRFLLMRMAYGEALGADCGGGSSSSNFLLLLYQLYSADLLAKNAEHDESSEITQHVRGLSAGFLVGMEIVDDSGFDRADPRLKRLERGVAFAAPMAALLSILLFNSEVVDMPNLSCSEKITTPSTTRQWEVYKSKFLSGLLRCAGLRHSLGVTDSGCVTSRGISTGRRNIEKARSFFDWSNDDDVSLRTTRSIERQRANMIDDYSRALRPMITLYVIFDQLSKEFVVDNDDERTLELSEQLATKLELCHKADSIHDLFRVAEINEEETTICKLFEKGATS